MNKRFFSVVAAIWCSVLFLLAPLAGLAAVRVWEQDEVIPTYIAGAPEKNPMFYFGRSSQGAEGRVYPYPLFDTLTGRKEDKTYRLVYLENEYLKIGIAPQIGGRVFSGMDKTNGYPFFYKLECDQARPDWIDRSLDFGRRRVEHSAPPSCEYLHAGTASHRGKR